MRRQAAVVNVPEGFPSVGSTVTRVEFTLEVDDEAGVIKNVDGGEVRFSDGSSVFGHASFNHDGKEDHRLKALLAKGRIEKRHKRFSDGREYIQWLLVIDGKDEGGFSEHFDAEWFGTQEEKSEVARQVAEKVLYEREDKVAPGKVRPCP